MKKIICLCLALVLVTAVFAGCAKKAEMQTLDVLKVTSVIAASTNKEIDKEAAVKAFNAATPGNVVDEDETDYKSTNELILFVTADGVVTVFVTGENEFIAHSEFFDYAFEIESAELYQLYNSAK